MHVTLGYAGRLFLVRIPHQGDHALAPDAARLVLTGVHQVAAGGSDADVGEVGVLLDPQAFAGLADDLGEQVGLVVPLSSGDPDFRLATDHGFGAQLEDADAAVAHVELRWATDHDPDAKKAQVLDLTRLGAWLHETGRVLLVEVAVPGLGELVGEQRTEELVRTLREIRELGVEADLWAVPGPLGSDTARALCDLVRDAGRDDVGILVVDEGNPYDADADADLPGAGVVGFVLGPDIWSDVLRRRQAGEIDETEAAAQVADLLRQRIARAGGPAGT